MRTIALLLEYDGTRYAGWQAQANALAIQSVVERALAKLLGEKKIRVKGSGRTDSGVHAEGQVCSFTTNKNLPLSAFFPGLNPHLPAEIRVLDAQEKDENFDPQRSAIRKRYTYRIVNRQGGTALLRARAWQVYAPLDWEKMARAAEAFVGEHDFAAFQGPRASVKTTVRRIEEVDVHPHGALHLLSFTGSGFLRGQVRSMVGTLVAVGKGDLPEDRPAALLEKPDRKGVGPTAPACGLTLDWVDYGEGPWIAPGGRIF
ncbi:MAG: tRNA pseudouridine(38-40) synthase TruA [Bdellovibrionota bacterium]